MQTPMKALILGLTVCLVVLLGLVSTVAAAEGSEANKVLQPQGLNHAGIYGLRQIEPSLTGSGVKFAVICRSITYIDDQPQNDYRPSVQHSCLKAAQLGFHDQGELPPGVSPHSTAICSVLLGEDADALNPDLGQFYYQGAAPGAEADVYEFYHFLINNVFGLSPVDADIIAAGIGSPFEDWWTRGIESLAEHYGLIVVATIGNGLNAYDPPLYPGAAANVIGVGVVDSVNTESLATSLAHFSLAYPEHSSFGPTVDGRCKPDIVAPGNCLAASASDPDAYEATGNWSSFSTPLTAGAIGLLVQKAKQEPGLSLAVSPKGGNCVMKAILLNSATKLPYWHKGRLQTGDDHSVPLDYVQGAGMLNAVCAYRHLIAGRNKPGDIAVIGWDNNQLDKSETLATVYRLAISEPTGKFITTTLVWNRHYRSLYPFEPLLTEDSNLRLELWAVDPDNPSSDLLLDYSDSSVDNVEHIYCKAVANYTDYKIVVSYSDVNDQPQAEKSQRYGLAWNVSECQNSDNIFWHDLNADGIVDKLDFAVLLDNWVATVKSPESYVLGDVNTDGTIDVNDLQILFDHNNRQAEWRK